MKIRVTLHKSGLAGGLIFLLVLCFSIFASAQEADTWQNEITIYGWYAGIDGTVSSPGGSDDISVEASDIIEDLNMIFMGEYEGKYNKWSVLVDAVYMDVGDTANAPVGGGITSVNLDIQSWVLHGGVGYDLLQSTHGTFGVVGGVRYLSLDAAVNLAFDGSSVTKKSDSANLLDGIIGIRGHVKLSDNWYLPYYADIGTGGSEFSYQLFAAIGYRFSWGDVRLGYRLLKFEMDDDKIMQDLEMSGPVLGVGIRF
jgi:hypothetical protein